MTATSWRSDSPPARNDRGSARFIAASLAATALMFACQGALAQSGDDMRRFGVSNDAPEWNRAHVPAVDSSAQATRGRRADDVQFGFAASTVSSGASIAGAMRCDGGTLDLNRTELDELHEHAAERRYHRDSVARGMTIAECVVSDMRDATVRAGSKLVVIVRAHLDEMDLPQAHPDSTVLWIDVLRDDSEMSRNADGKAALMSVLDNAREHCATFAVRAHQLRPRSLVERWDSYQEALLPLGSACADATTDDARGVQRIVLRVRYAGSATIGLHSVAISETSRAGIMPE